MRNLARINNYYNTIEARRDWQRIAATADPYIAALFAPPADAGWRTIDKCIANLREAMQAPKWAEKFTPEKQAMLGRICKPAPAGGEAL